MKRLSAYGLAGLALVAVVLSAVAAITWGSEPVAFGDVWRTLGHHLSFGRLAPAEPTADRIVWDVRLPRVLLALLAGGGLALVGAAMQALVRNPLAEPYILGISGGASAGASLFYLGFLPPLLSQTLTLPLAAFLGALAAITLVFLVARTGPVLSVARLLLAGIAMSALMGAVTSFVTYVSPDANKVRTILFWLLGSLSGTRWTMVPLPAIVTLAGFLALQALARPLDALLTGEEAALHLGVPVEFVKRFLIVAAALMTGTLVAYTGAIGFVGLIIPHAVRSLAGVAHARVLPWCFAGGALFLLWADLLARTLLPGQELPVGFFTACCGVPFFLYLLRRNTYAFGL